MTRPRAVLGPDVVLVTDIWVASRLLKKTHMPPASLKQAFRIVALDRCGNHFRSKRSRSDVPPKYASARRFFARLASEIFLTSLQTDVFNNPLVRNYTSGEVSNHGTDSSEGPSDACPVESYLDQGGMSMAKSASYGTCWR